jgi:hypothetical protein
MLLSSKHRHRNCHDEDEDDDDDNHIHRHHYHYRYNHPTVFVGLSAQSADRLLESAENFLFASAVKPPLQLSVPVTTCNFHRQNGSA